ncbi:hypothetical protein [Leifsonia sp. TF02-11]|uniref:hypothetical protein n=1 Tax=Leifsonia sp. TF02-11 TaxID=2815212 RepID=UPI001AA12CB9|nr:hypothetical protein [Leifsonia sp. TF02-11]MBO1739668.1 hypothetical protein [Leifsonia sp. TF02-11]
MGIEWHFDLHFDELKAEMATKAEEAVLAGMSFMHGQVTPLVPIETGELAGSGDVGLGYVDGAAVGSHEHVAHLFYPGPYALYQHEGVYFRRPATYGAPLTHTHGESFFLIRPMLTDADTAIDIIRERLGL